MTRQCRIGRIKAKNGGSNHEKKLPLIFLPLLLIALSACSRRPSPPTAELPVLATQPTEQTTIPPEQINEPGQESSSQPVTEPMPEPTAPSVTEPASHRCGSGHAPNTEPASQPPQPTGRLPQSHRQHPQPEPTTEPPAPPGQRSRQSPIRHRLLDRLCADRRHGKGLVLEPSAVECWDNRISANQTAFTWSETSPPD